MAFIEMDFASGGGGSLKDFATLEVSTTDSDLIGKTIDISCENFDRTPLFVLNSITLNGTQNIKGQSIGLYNFYYNGDLIGSQSVEEFTNYSVDLVTLLRNYYPSENSNGHASYNTVDQSSSAIRGGGLNKAFDSDTSIGCYFDPIKYGGNGSYWEWIFDTPIKVKSIKAILKGATGSTKTYKGYLFADSGSGYEQLKPYDFTMATEENVLEYEFENITTVSKIKINCYDSTFSTSANLVSVCLNPTT